MMMICGVAGRNVKKVDEFLCAPIERSSTWHDGQRQLFPKKTKKLKQRARDSYCASVGFWEATGSQDQPLDLLGRLGEHCTGVQGKSRFGEISCGGIRSLPLAGLSSAVFVFFPSREDFGLSSVHMPLHMRSNSKQKCDHHAVAAQKKQPRRAVNQTNLLREHMVRTMEEVSEDKAHPKLSAVDDITRRMRFTQTQLDPTDNKHHSNVNNTKITQVKFSLGIQIRAKLFGFRTVPGL